MEDRLYPIAKAASILGVHTRTLKRWGRNGHVNILKPGGSSCFLSATEIQRLMQIPARAVGKKEGNEIETANSTQ